MTPKDLRLKYHCQVKNSPFDEQFQIDIDDYNHDDVEAYIEYLEEELLRLNNQLQETSKIKYGG